VHQRTTTPSQRPGAKQGSGRKPRLITIAGGKGGVGKSVLASNLAVALGQQGHEVVLVDADLGQANQHTLFGIHRPARTLQAYVDRKVKSLEDTRIETCHEKVQLVAGMGAVVGAANIPHAQKQKVLRAIRRLDTAVVIVDVGAGSSFNTLDFFDMGDLRLLVATPQLTSLQNAYAFLKAALYRALRFRASTTRERDLIKGSSDRSEQERVRQLLTRISGEDPELGELLDGVVKSYSCGIIGNQLQNAREERTLDALAKMASDFLDLQLKTVATISHTDAIHRSIARTRPFLLDAQGETNARAIHRLAMLLMGEDLQQIRQRQAMSPPRVTPELEAAAGAGPEGPTHAPGDLLDGARPVLWYSRVRGAEGWAVGRIERASERGLMLRCSAKLQKDELLELAVARAGKGNLIEATVEDARPPFFELAVQRDSRPTLSDLLSREDSLTSG